MALDIVFISYHEPNANNNWKLLVKRFPYAMRVNGIEGIPQAFVEAARISKTSHVWTIDADNVIEDDFDFSFEPEEWDRKYVHLWHSRNPINHLEYGYGGVKLWPRKYLKQAVISSTCVDFTVPASHGGESGLKIHPEVASTSYFNTTPFDAYRAGFREAAKLAAESINESYYTDIGECRERLNIWCTVGDGLYGQECMQGAKDGKKYGQKYHVNPGKLSKINDFNFIHEKFKEAFNCE